MYVVLPYEKGVAPHSELYESTASRQAQEVLYYLQRAGHFFCDTHYVVERTCYHSFLLICVLHGRLLLSARGQEYSIVPGQFGFLNCYEPHVYRAAEPLEYFWLHFDGANTAAFCEAIWQVHGAVICPTAPLHLRKQMEQILDQLRSVGHVNEVTASRRLHDLLCSLLYGAGQNEADDPLTAAAQQFLAEHLAENLPTAQLAQEFHLSASQLNRLFRQHTGQSVHEYLVNLRINRAKSLLKESCLSVTEIAGAVGYEYDTSFSAVFRDKVGMSPRQFRNMPV